MLVIVLLHTDAARTASIASDAGTDVRAKHVELRHLMACFLRATDKLVRKRVGRTVLVAAAFQNQDLYRFYSSEKSVSITTYSV